MAFFKSETEEDEEEADGYSTLIEPGSMSDIAEEATLEIDSEDQRSESTSTSSSSSSEPPW